MSMVSTWRKTGKVLFESMTAKAVQTLKRSMLAYVNFTKTFLKRMSLN